MNKKNVGYILISLGVMIFVYVIYANSRYININRPFSSYTLLSSSWEKYKNQFISQDGRVVDFTQENTTTSEGQSYAMLRSIYIDDKTTFDKVWLWTKENMKRPQDNLFGWRWGLKENNTFGFLENGGDNSASDADTDIALALIFAGNRWKEEKYIEEAKEVLNDIWKIETDTAVGKRYLIAGNWAKNQNELVINPSYFSPHAWRIFAQVDKDHNWTSLIDPAYELLFESGNNNLDKEGAVGLPPDWIVVDRRTGELRPPQLDNLTTNYAFDAMRIPWKISLDYQWNKDENAYKYLTSSFKKLTEIYSQNNRLPSSFSHNGQVLTYSENPAMYATAIGYFMVVNPDMARKIYEEKIIRLYSNDSNMFHETIPYYEQNWLWFGSGIYNRQLIPYS